MEGQGGEDTQNHFHYQGSPQMTDYRRQVVSIDTQRPGSCGVQSRSKFFMRSNWGQWQCQLPHLQTLIAIDSEGLRRCHGIGLIVDTDLMIWKFTSAIVVGVEEFVVRILFLFAKMSTIISWVLRKISSALRKLSETSSYHVLRLHFAKVNFTLSTTLRCFGV